MKSNFWIFVLGDCWSRRFGWVSLLIMALLVPTADAQLIGTKDQKTNSENVPFNAVATVTVFPKQLAEDPNFDSFPREVVTAWGQKEFGFDPLLINQVTFIVKELKNLDSPPQWAAVLHFEEMQGLTGSILDQLDEKKLGGKTLFSGTASGRPSVLIYDDVTMFVGDEIFLKDMLVEDQSSALVDLIKSASVKGQLQAFADIESLRPMLNEALASMPGYLPPSLVKLKLVPDMISAIEIGVRIDGRLKTTLIVHANDVKTAEKLQSVFAEAIEFGSDFLIGILAAQMDFNDPVQEAAINYLQRLAQFYREKLTPEINGQELTFQLDEEPAILPLLAGLLLPAAQQTRAAARRTESTNNCRQMALAMHNFESANGHLPAQASYDAEGKPLLSWRVHILPYVDQQELYAKFHLDEPWDSPHNKKLIPQIPRLYQSPSVENQNGKTVYLGVAGDGMMFGKDKKTFASVTDGTSNTIWTVEADPEMALEWTKPEDWKFDPKDPLHGLGHVQAGGFIAGYVDGSVRFLPAGIDPGQWKSMLTLGGGEVLENNR